MTASKEDYIKIIYKLGLNPQPFGNKAIAQGLGVAAGSVTEMLRKLEQDGLIAYAPYKGIALTAKGMSTAQELIAKHRLWEVFLVKKLGYDWSDVHDQAELLEHVTAPHLAKRLAMFLDYPSYCPHGWQIPYDNSAEDNSAEYPPLTQFNTGDTVAVMRVPEEKELLGYLSSVGMQIGDILTINKFGEYHGAVTVTSANGKVCDLSYKAACLVFCKAVGVAP